MPDLVAGPGIELVKEDPNLLRISTDVVSGRLAFSTYSSLAAYTPTTAGTVAEVPTSDAGTHTDPVIGGTVSNSGVFRYSTSPAGWQRISNVDALSASPYATAAAASAAEAKASAESAATRVTRNLYNYLTNTANKRLDTSGVPQTNAGTQVSDFIPVSPSTQYAIARFAPIAGQEGHLKSGFSSEYAQYDASKNFIAGTWASSWPLTTHASAAFIRLGDVADSVASQVQVQQGAVTDDVFTPYATYTPSDRIKSRKYEGLKVAIFGDSISRNSESWWREIIEPLGFANNPFDDSLANPSYAIAGRAIADRPAATGNDTDGAAFSTNSFYQKRTIVSTARNVLILGPAGTNDWSSPYDATFGTMASRNSTSFYGALHLLCQYFADNFPAKDIYFVTPTPRVDAFTWSAYSSGSGGPTSLPAVGATPTGWSVNSLGKTLEDYVNAMIEVCGFYGLPCIDVFHESFLRVFDETERALNMGDHVHPTQAGHRLLGRQVLKAIEARAERP